MKIRIVNNWRTTLFGLILLIVSVVMLYLKIISGGEFIALLPTIVGLLCAPDSFLRRDAGHEYRDTGRGTKS